MGGNVFKRYVLPGAETAAGTALMFVPGAQPIGLGLIGSGVGQLGGRAIAGDRGQATGGTVGGLLGGLGSGMFSGGGGGAAAPGDGFLSSLMHSAPVNKLTSLFGAQPENWYTQGKDWQAVNPINANLPGAINPPTASASTDASSKDKGLFGLTPTDMTFLSQMLPQLNKMGGVDSSPNEQTATPLQHPAIQFTPTIPQPQPATVASRAISPLHAYLASQGMLS